MLALIAVVGIQQANELSAVARRLSVPLPALVLLILVIVVLLAVLVAAVVWSRTAFAVGTDTVYLRKGVIGRQQRSAKLDRLQAIDVVQPLLGRMFGLSELRIDVAGGMQSNLSLAYLRDAQARALRAELLTISAGLKAARGAAGVPVAPGGPVVPGDQVVAAGSISAGGQVQPGPVVGERLEFDRPVFQVTSATLIGSLLLSWGLIVTIIAIAIIIGVYIATQSAAAVIPLLPMGLGFAGILWASFSRGFNFQGGIAPEGIRLRHGLLETRHQTVPPGRVQAIQLSQSILWRRRQWWQVSVNVAGYGQENQLETSMLLPVGTFDTVMCALWLVLPDLGTKEPRQLLSQAMVGTGNDDFVTVSPRARLLDPLTWRRTGFVQTQKVTIIRRGWLRRQVTIVPHEKTQSLSVNQGPLQRALNVVSFHLHSTSGPARPMVPHLDPVVADQLMSQQAVIATAARKVALPEQWFATVSAAYPETPAAEPMPPPDGTQFGHPGQFGPPDQKQQRDIQ